MGTNHWECRGRGLGWRRSELPRRERVVCDLLEVFHGSTFRRAVAPVRQILMHGITRRAAG